MQTEISGHRGKRAGLMAMLTVLAAVSGGNLPAKQENAQAPPLKEPEYINQFFRLGNDGQLVPLEQEKLGSQTKSHRNFVISPSVTSEQIVPNPASPVRVPPDAHFVVRLNSGDRDPNTLISLTPFVVKKKDREIPKSKASAGIIPFSGVKSQTAPDKSIPVSVKKYGNGSFEIVPTQPLVPGEYAFVTGYSASCFGVDSQSLQ